MFKSVRKISSPDGSTFEKVYIHRVPHFVARIISTNRGRVRTKIDDLGLFSYTLRKAFGSQEPLVSRKKDSCVVVVVGKYDRDLFEILRLIEAVIRMMQIPELV